MNPNNKLLTATIIALILGISAGYAVEYYTTQPKINQLTTDLSTANTRLTNTTATLTTKNNEIAKLVTEATTSSTKINTLNQQLIELRSQLTADANTTIAKLNTQIFQLQNTLNETQHTLADLKPKNITITARGTAFVDDNGVSTPTNRTLVATISWTGTRWAGIGYYTVNASQTNSDIGLDAGYVYILDVYSLTNVTITGNKVDASGTVILTDRSFLLNQPITITGTANNDGKSDDQVTVNWPSIDSNSTLLGTIKINSPTP